MTSFFEAASVARTATSEAGDLEITLRGPRGETFTLAVGGGAAEMLALALRQSVEANRSRAPGVTKRPHGFSVGRGRFEDVVLVRFEDDVPYGLTAADAAELGQALLDEADAVEQLPAGRVQ